MELAPLTAEDFEKILNGTHACLTAQYKALLKTEGVRLSFTDDAVRAIAEVAWRINERGENIGARRLYTIMERLLDDISFDADKMKGQSRRRRRGNGARKTLGAVRGFRAHLLCFVAVL